MKSEHCPIVADERVSADDALGEPVNGRYLLPTAEAFHVIGCGKTKGWSLIRDGVLETVRIGRLQNITARSIRRVIENGA